MFIKMTTCIFLILNSVLLFNFKLVSGNTSAQDCQKLTDCTKCIRKANCVWCKNHEFEVPGHSAKSTPRCNTIQEHQANKFGSCPNSQLEIPKSSFEIVSNIPVDQKQKIHISPQEIHADLAVGQPITFELTYLEDKDKFLDLYYILDLSHTMKEHKKTVAEQSQKLADTLKSLTNEVRLGFGSFIDKPVLPFASYAQISQKDGWMENGQTFAPPYGFKNHLSLTNKTLSKTIDDFKQAVEKSKISGNIDQAEGGLEAVMQAIVCEKQIGWREDAHRLIVMATDGPFHIAGDGKIGGIVIPNDMKCHLNSNGDYTHSTLIDYPSIGQLNYTIGKNKAHLIFAITKPDVIPLYEQLSKQLQASSAALLQDHSDDVVNVVRKEYESISQKVELQLTQDVASNYLKVDYKAKCPDSGGKWEDKNKCGKVAPGNTIKFQVTLTLLSCPGRNERIANYLKLSTYNLPGKEGLNISLNLICDCKCSGNIQPQIDYDKELLVKTCNGNANRLKCGKCVCDKDHQGSNCECTRFGGNDSINKTNCQDPNKYMTECSGRGTCECGQCTCKLGWSGQYCQCNDFNCRVNENERECSNGRGKCNCGTCECDDQYGGDKCQCPKDNKTCKEPGSNSVCNSHGKCICDSRKDISYSEWEWQCNQCDPGYSGKYCHICRGADCATSRGLGSRCEEKEMSDCLKCHYRIFESVSIKGHGQEKTGTEECSSLCSKTNQNPNDIVKYDVKLSPGLSEDENSGISCEQPYNETCNMKFLYTYQNGAQRLELKVILETSLTCRPPPPTLWYIIGTVAAVLLIGILTLLLWKIFTHIHDTREFQRFEKERAAAKWDMGENPLYSTPMSTFENPGYRN